MHQRPHDKELIRFDLALYVNARHHRQFTDDLRKNAHELLCPVALIRPM